MLNEVQTENIDVVTSPYSMFKYSIRTELTRKYYERRIRTFFDFIDFMVGFSGMDEGNIEDIKNRIEEYLTMNEAFQVKSINIK